MEAPNMKLNTIFHAMQYGLVFNVILARLAKIGVKLTELSKDQADYIGVTTSGPFKPEHYRY